MTPDPSKLCPCGKPLREGNGTGLCHLCQKAGKTLRFCTCGCGLPVTRWSTTGYALPCWRRLLAMGQAPRTARNTT